MALSDTQLVLLSAASQREDLLVSLPPHPRAGAARTSLSKLLSKGLLEEVPIGREQPQWRLDDDGRPAGLRITRAGLEAIRIEPDRDRESINGASNISGQGAILDTETSVQNRLSAPRDSSKQALVIRFLRRGEGASLDELTAATGWLPHTTRAALTGLRKKGHAVTREKREDGTSLYRIVEPEV